MRSSGLKDLQLSDTVVADGEDDQCEDDDSAAVVLSSDDEHGELYSENDDDGAGDDYCTNRHKVITEHATHT